MVKIGTTVCLIFGVFFGSVTVSWSADFQARVDSYKRGNYRAALQVWLALAEHGDAMGQIRLGDLYLNGQGVPRDTSVAARWYRLADKPPTRNTWVGSRNSSLI